MNKEKINTGAHKRAGITWFRLSGRLAAALQRAQCLYCIGQGWGYHVEPNRRRGHHIELGRRRGYRIQLNAEAGLSNLPRRDL